MWLGVTPDQDFGEICLSLRALPLPLILLLGRGDDVHPGRQDDVLRPVDLVEVDAVGVDRVGVEVVRLRRGVLVSQCRTLELEESGRHKTPLLPWLWSDCSLCRQTDPCGAETDRGRGEVSSSQEGLETGLTSYTSVFLSWE